MSGAQARRRRLWGLAALAAIAALMAAARLLIDRPLGGAVAFRWPDETVAWLRLTAIASAAAAGAALGVSGTMLQALLRNPLADPFILGISGGAGLGVMAAIYVGWAAGHPVLGWLGGDGGMVAPAAVGAIAALALVQALGQRRGTPDPLALVLAGVVVSSMCGALILFLQHLAPHGLRGDLSTWMMGRLPEVTDRWLLSVVGGLAVLGVLAGVWLGSAMDAATFGDDETHALGVALPALRWTLGVIAGVLAAAAVALTGPLAFVGLVAPHAARLFLGARHGALVVGASLMGAALLLAADCLRQALDFGGGRVPVGVFTALAGGPVFLVLLRAGASRGNV